MSAMSNGTGDLGRNNTGQFAQVEELSKEAQVLLIIAYVIIMPVALVGNIFVVRTVCTVDRMRTPTNVMFVNMALFDIIVALSIMPTQIAHVLHPFRWIGGVVGLVTCKLSNYAFYISIAGSIFALVVMAFDRFFAIVLPFLNVRFFKRYKLLTCLIWFCSMTLMLPIVILQNVKFIDGIYQCSTDWWQIDPYLQSYRIFISLNLALLYLFPLAIMTILYSLIAHRLWFARIPGLSLATEDTAKRDTKKKRKVVKMLVIVLLMFALCWLPVQVTHFMLLSKVPVTQPFFLFSFWVCHANSALNPCLYIILHSGFRRAFLKLFGKRCQESRFMTQGTVMSSVHPNDNVTSREEKREALL